MYRDINNRGDLDLRKELELGVRAIQGRQGNPSDGSERFQKRPEERQKSLHWGQSSATEPSSHGHVLSRQTASWPQQGENPDGCTGQ